MTERFDRKTVIITGAGRGIGRGIADTFAAAGANVMIGARTMSHAEAALAAIRDAGGTAEAFHIDVKEKATCIALIAATISRFGSIDVLIHCAADIAHGGLGQVSDEALEAGFASIAKAAWWLLEAARPHLSQARDGGRFIAISSVNGPVTMVPGMTAYGMAKSALDAFVRGAALDVVAENITVNAVVPGFIASARATEVLGAAGVAAYGAGVPVGRPGTAGDIAHACLYLASARASYVTGTNLKVDGGATISTSRRDGLLDTKLKQQTQGS